MTSDTAARMAYITMLRKRRGGTWMENLGVYLREVDPGNPDVKVSYIEDMAKATLHSRGIILVGADPTLIDYVLCHTCASLLSTEQRHDA